MNPLNSLKTDLFYATKALNKYQKKINVCEDLSGSEHDLNSLCAGYYRILDFIKRTQVKINEQLN